MTSPQMLRIAQHYDGPNSTTPSNALPEETTSNLTRVFRPASTSPSEAPSTPVMSPTSMLQVGTTTLAQEALLMVLLSYEAAISHLNLPRAFLPKATSIKRTPAVATERSSEMVSDIISMFGMNRSQAADVMQVRRQSIYNWLGGAEAEGDNLIRMICLYRIAKSLTTPIDPHLAVRSTPDGTNSLLRMLSADRLDPEAILAWTTELSRPNEIPWPKPLDEVLREAGIPRNAELERQRGADGIRHLQG